SDSHARFLAHCFLHLAGPDGRLPSAWVGAQMAQLDRLDGDIDTLMTRIAHIRTWTYITHRVDWVEGAADWQDRARRIEDKLSDALHDRITQRFVDRRSAFLVRHLAGDAEILASVDKAGEVRVEGSYVGRLDGPGRGVVFQLVDTLGCLATADVAAPLKALDVPGRRALGRLGVRFGRETIYVEPLLGLAAVRFRALLWAVRHGRVVPPLPGARHRGKAIAVDPELPISFYAAIGRRVLGGLALRPDRLERLAALARDRARAGRFRGDAELAAIAGIMPGELRA